MNDAAPIPALTAEVAKEVALLDFMIQEALLIHETTKADALNKQKPVPMTALRFAIQAQKLRLGLLGIAPEPRPRRAPKADAPQSKTIAPQALACPAIEDTPESESPLLETQTLEYDSSLASETASPQKAKPAAPRLNRAQRRAQQRLRTRG